MIDNRSNKSMSTSTVDTWKHFPYNSAQLHLYRIYLKYGLKFAVDGQLAYAENLPDTA